MADVFTWKAEMEFRGTAEDFNKLMGSLRDAPVEFNVAEWHRRPHHLAGCMPMPIDLLVGRDWLDKLVKDSSRVQLQFIQDIAGGIRGPHFHWGDQVVLLDQAKFKTFVGRVAQELAARRVDAMGDYIEVMDPIGRLGAQVS